MKKFLKILLIVLLSLFLIVLVIPVFFKGEIMNIAREQVNKNVRATVDWKDFSVSLLKGFPDLKVTMEDVSVLGQDKFEGDTLMAFKDFSAKLDIISAFSGKVNVKSIIINKAVVRAIALKDGSVNWDITYPSDDSTAEEEVDTTASTFQIDLKKFIVKDGTVHYYDEELDMFAYLDLLDIDLSGNFSEDYSDLELNSISRSFTFEYDGIKYINKAVLSVVATIGADLVNFKFSSEVNEIKLNELIMGVNGFVSMPDDDINMDIRYFTKESDFKNILSLIPAIYMSDFAGMQATGKVVLEGDAIGTYNDSLMPRVNVLLDITNGRFAYPDLPKSAENIQVDMKVFYDGVHEDNTRIDLNRFHIEMAGNPIDMTFHAITPMTDMQMNGTLVGKVDLSSITDVIPVEDMSLSGIINANLKMMGRYSDIENENYENFNAEGSFSVSDMEVKSEEIPVPVFIKRAVLNFTPRYAELSTFDAIMGKSDLKMNGRLENFIPYVLKDEEIRGSLSLASSLLDINQLMGESIDDTEAVEDTVALSVIEVPRNINFNLNANIDKLVYDNLEIDNIKGKLSVKDGVVSMDKLAMDLLEGSMLVSGKYDPRDILMPLMDLELNLSEIDISSSFHAFNTVEKLAPVAQMTKGKVSVDFAFTSLLDTTMQPVLTSILGSGSLKAKELQIVNNNTLDKVAGLLKNDKLKDPSFKDIKLFFEVNDGRVYVQPFDTKIGPAKLNVQGDQGLDQTMNYLLEFKIPRDEFGNTANDAIENLASLAGSKGFNVKPGENVNVNVSIVGNFTDPKISLNLKDAISNVKDDIKEALQEKVSEEVDKLKESVKEDLSAEIDKIMKDAEAEAEKIKKAAADAAEALVGEAQLRKKQLVKEAGSNPLKKIAAEKTGDGLVNAAQSQGNKLISEAETKADAIMELARKKAEEMR